MILTLTPNPALDCTWRVDGLVPGDSHRVATGTQRAGGKGVNVARVLTAIGVDALALTTAGGDTGEALAEDLRVAGIPHRLIPVTAATRRSIAIVDDGSGDATLLNETGAPLSASEAAALLEGARALAADSAVVVVSGSLPPGISATDIAALVAGIAGSGVTTIADVTGPALMAAAAAGAHVVKPNAAELRETTGCSGVLAGARLLCERGAGLVVVSLGADGMVFVRGGDPRRVLRARLLAKQQEERDAAASDARKSQIRGMDRSERIRTYNFPENRIADHRTGYKAYNLDQVMDGALEPIVQSAITADEEARLAALGS